MTAAAETMFLALLMLAMVAAAALILRLLWWVFYGEAQGRRWREECHELINDKYKLEMQLLNRSSLSQQEVWELQAKLAKSESYCRQCEEDLAAAESSLKLNAADYEALRKERDALIYCPHCGGRERETES